MEYRIFTFLVYKNYIYIRVCIIYPPYIYIRTNCIYEN